MRGNTRRSLRLAAGAGLCFWLTVGLAAGTRADVSELVGEPAPEVRARPLESDRPIELAQYRGRVVVLVFVASWCPACRRLAPELEALQSQHREAGLTVLALSHEPRERLRRHVERESPTYPLAQCTGRTAIRFHADGLPTTVVIDREGTVAAAYQGATSEIYERLRSDVGRLLTR